MWSSLKLSPYLDPWIIDRRKHLIDFLTTLLRQSHSCRPNSDTCFLSSRVQVRLQYTVETVVGFILPYTIIIISYVLILRRLRQTRFNRKVRSENLILAIVVMFGLFWLPYHIINLMQVRESMFTASQITCLRRLFWGFLSEWVCSGAGGSRVLPRGFTQETNVSSLRFLQYILWSK